MLPVITKKCCRQHVANCCLGVRPPLDSLDETEDTIEKRKLEKGGEEKDVKRKKKENGKQEQEPKKHIEQRRRTSFQENKNAEFLDKTITVGNYVIVKYQNRN
jgi:hypothetical protein